MLFACCKLWIKKERKKERKNNASAQLLIVLLSETIQKSLCRKSFISITSDNFDQTHLLLHYSKCLYVTLKHDLLINGNECALVCCI